MKRLFIRNPEGEPAGYIADIPDSSAMHADDQLKRNVADFILAELENVLGFGESELTIQFYVKDMTDEEVEALPEI